MTDNRELNINNFCPLDCYVPTFEDSKGNTAFIVRHDLYDALGLPEGFNHEEYLAQSEWERRMPNYARDESDAWQVVTESGFYKLVLMGHAAKAKAFQAWVSGVVVPAIQADGMYLLGEELRFGTPENLGINVRKLNGLQVELKLFHENLTSVVLPELRRDQIYMINAMSYLDSQDDQHERLESNLVRLMKKKAARGKPTNATLQ